MTTPLSPAPQDGRGAAMAVYVLFLLSIPSAAIFALIGVMVALASRDDASPLARSHLDYQIKIWFTSFWWTIALFVAAAVGMVLTVVLIGFPILWLAGLGFLIIFLWFTVMSFIGLLALLDNRPRLP
jgi:uncharacterized membrane protein